MKKYIAHLLQTFMLFLILGVAITMVHSFTNNSFPSVIFAHDQCNTDKGCNNNNVCVAAHKDGPGRHCVEPTKPPPPPPPPAGPPPPPPGPGGGGPVCNAATPADVMLVIDTSNSMGPSQGNKLADAKRAAKAFVDKVAGKGTIRVGLASFDNHGRVHRDVSSDYGGIKGAIENLGTGGNIGTCLECAIDADKGADDVLGSFGKVAPDNHKRHVIILTDGKINRYMQQDGDIKGDQTGQEEAKAREQALAAIGRVSSTHNAVFWIAQYGPAINTGYLQGIVDTYIGGQGKYYNEAASGSLDAIYDTIAKELVGSTITAYVYDDKDQDGSPDSGDPAMSGVSVNLADGTNNTTQTTGTDGKTIFKNLCATSFILTATPPTGYTASPENTSTRTFTLELGSSRQEDFGMKKPGSEPIKEFTFNFKLALHGLGIAGDNVLLRPNPCQRTRNATAQPTCLSNQVPLHPTRGLTVEMINNLRETVATVSGSMNYSSSSGIFETQLKVTSTSATPKGNYTFRLQTPMFLAERVLFSQTIEAGNEYAIPLADMVSSDVDNDNVLTILDYNMIIRCYNFPKQPNPCNDADVAQVDNDDNGVIDEFNVNLFVRDISVLQ